MGEGPAGAGRPRRARRWLLGQVGGPARLRVVLVLAATQALDGADKGTVSVNASSLEHAFGVHNTAIGLLVSVVSLVGAACTLPAGVLTDRVDRTRMLAAGVALWSGAMALSALAPSYDWLLASRVLLGVLTAVVGPGVASLTGDYLPAGERARLYGFVLAGEFLGAALGYALSSQIATVLSWRLAFAWLLVPGLLLARLLWRLPEPRRGGADQLPPGWPSLSAMPGRGAPAGEPDDARRPGPDLARRVVDAAGTPPRRSRLPDGDPADLPAWRAFGYVVRVPTNVVIIVGSALGYFFLSGLQSFAMLFATSTYGIGRPLASALVLVVGVGALAGVFTGGRVADHLLGRGRLDARVAVPAVALLTAPLALAPAFAVHSVAAALPLLVLGAGLLTAADPPFDAARLDVVPPRLWGRAEGVRTAARSVGQFTAPLLFGYLSDHVFAGPDALAHTLLFGLVALALAGVLALVGMRTYPADVATANAAARRHRHRS